MSMLQSALFRFRQARVNILRGIGREPRIRATCSTPLEYHGNRQYGGWAIPSGVLDADAVVVDVGLGEDISFSESLIRHYGCTVQGFDPTPKSIAYVTGRCPPNFRLHSAGVAGSTRAASFYLPSNEGHVSGSIARAPHVGDKEIKVELIDLDGVFERIGSSHIDLLKVDIEGAEYELIESRAFTRHAASIRVICVEFHHRWEAFGPGATTQAVAALRALGFECVWRSVETNEEFTFCNTRSLSR